VLFGAPLLSGLLFGTVRQFRSEPLALLVSAVLSYLSCTALTVRQRIVAVTILVSALWMTLAGWEMYFERKFETASEVIRDSGGTPWQGPRVSYHPLWHPIFCGLGDFGAHKGYGWEDRVPYAYAAPFIEARHGVELRVFWDGWCYNWTDPPDPSDGTVPKNCNSLELFPSYPEIIRGKILRDAVEDPSWFISVYTRRVLALLDTRLPLNVHLPSGPLTVPFNGWMGVCCFLGLVLLRRWTSVKVALLFFPLAATAIVIHSGAGFRHYWIFPQVSAALLIGALVEIAFSGASRATRSREPV
jgi:hypothetical protein